MTPEQLDRKEVDHRSDIFAFRTLLYEMLTGRKAFDGEDRAEIAAAIREGQPPPLPATATSGTPGLEAVIEKCSGRIPTSAGRTPRRWGTRCVRYGAWPRQPGDPAQWSR